MDFTASNGAVHSPGSLHYINPAAPNQYQMATRAVLEICEHYNRTKVFEAVGFGAKIPPDYAVSHLFPLVGFAANADLSLLFLRMFVQCSDKCMASRE